MDPLDPLRIRLEVDALNAEFAWLIDHDQSHLVAALFTEDGAYGRSTGQWARGREAIAETYRQRVAHGERTTRHLFSNLRLQPPEDRLVKGTVILTLYGEDGKPPHPAVPLVIADYDDIYQLCDDGRWRYRERLITWFFKREGATSPLRLGAAGGG
ncbi:MAG: nuclear transport factor 2 family protein [Acetobacteraceae bacterium]